MRKWRWSAPCLLVAALTVAMACTATPSDPAGAPPPEADDSSAAVDTTSADGTATAGTATDSTEAVDAADVDIEPLPEREGPRRETTYSVPHIQIDAVLVPEVDAELRRRAFALPGVEERESLISLPGARSLWLSDDLDLARPEVLLTGREFAHIHPDGSLHAWIPVARAHDVAIAKWGELHPWVGREDFWDGVVMLYTPETLDEVDVTMQVLVEAYNFITGASLDPTAF